MDDYPPAPSKNYNNMYENVDMDADPFGSKGKAV
jgi:hypothetical protein